MSLKKLLKGKRTLIMGIMNLTPDSFSGDGRSKNSASANLRYAKALVCSGADILDVGGESSRPGAAYVPVSREIARILPTIKLLAKHLDVPISVDTYKPEVAEACLAQGVSMINNIMGTQPDRGLLKIVRKHKAFIILMHMRGDPRTMQRKTAYRDVVRDVIGSLRNAVEICLENGIKKDRIIIDPGIGFAKTAEQNLQILNYLGEFQKLRLPVLIGTSRKSFIGRILNAEAQGRAWGTAATVALSIANGARLVRVHDVAAMKQVAVMTDAIMRTSK